MSFQKMKYILVDLKKKQMKCPFCQNHSLFEYCGDGYYEWPDGMVIETKYSFYPNFQCDTCGADALIDRRAMPKMSKALEQRKDSMLKLPLVFIARVLPSNLTRYISKTKLDEMQIHSLLQHKIDNVQMKSFALKKKKKNWYLKDPHLMNLSVNVQSYNLNSPLNVYPSKTDLDHMGKYLYVQVQTRTGKLKITYFAGCEC